MDKSSVAASPSSLVVWISDGRGVIYANDAFCRYTGQPIEHIIGRAATDLAQITSGEISDFFENPISAAIPNRLLADASGRIFELKTSARQSITDILFDEVSVEGSLEKMLQPVSGTPFYDLTEEELLTARIPDLRFITVCSAHLKSSSALVDKIPPLEHRIIAGTFWEETGNAFKNNSCTVHPPRSSMSTGFAGAPRYHSDHSLRALGAAFEQVSRIERIRANCSEEGREIPSIGCGVASGNALVGAFGSGSLTTYLSEGDCVECAERLARIASPGEVLITQIALDHLFANLPDGWHVTESSADGEIDLSRYASHVGSVFPLENTPRVFTVGPVEGEECDKAVYRFEEIWQLENGDSPPTPVFRAILLSDSGSVPNSAGTILEAGYLGRLGKYRLTDLIGSGGMGRVWKAQDFYGNTVAIKTLNSQSAQSEDATRRFRREAEVMSRVPHRNICRIFETGEHDGTHFIAMEYVEGATLSEILQSEAASSVSRTGTPSDISTLISAVRQSRTASGSSPKSETGSLESDQPVTAPSKDGVILPIDQTIGLMEKICEAVEFAHQHGVLHRDLKPGNILLRADGEPSVADFGLAKLSVGGTEGDAPSLSLSGQVVGTVENMAPEQAESSKDVDARADVYSLGTILYQMCTGRRHFKATGNFVADLQTLQTHEPVRPRAINPSLDSDLEIIILKCLRTEPDARYRSVSALLADLRHFQRGEPITAKASTNIDLIRKLVRRNKAAAIIALSASGLILLVIAGSFWSLSDRLAKEKLARTEAERMRQLAESAASAQLTATQRANQMEAAQSASRVQANSAIIDLGSGTGTSRRLVPAKGDIFHVLAFNRNYALLKITGISGQTMAYQWRTPEGDEGSGTLDFDQNPKTIKLPGIQVGWNNYSKRMEFFNEKGSIWAAKPIDPSPTSWDSIFSEKNSSSAAGYNLITYVRTPLSGMPLEEVVQKANSNDKVAQIELGHRYKSGEKGVERNNDLAAVWYQKASLQGSLEADMCIARLNWHGRMNIEPASWENAFLVMERLAVLEGSGPSQYFAGLCFLEGRGTEVNYSEAAYWFEKSSEHPGRNPYKAHALWELGKLHLEGKGTTQDLSKARDLIRQAAELDHEEAKKWLQNN